MNTTTHLESPKAAAAFEDYYALGPGRSLTMLAERYVAQRKHGATTPTRHRATLGRWSRQFAWQERVAQRDAELAAAAQQALERQRAEAIQSGFALFFRRIARLNELAELLWEEINTEHKRWLRDVKQIGSGEFAERIDLIRFNAGLIEQFRKTLEDLAAEMGERAKGIEISGRGGGPLEVRNLEAMYERDLESLAQLMRGAAADSAPDADGSDG